MFISDIYPILIVLLSVIRTLYSIVTEESFKPIDYYGQDLIFIFFLSVLPIILFIITTIADKINGY